MCPNIGRRWQRLRGAQIALHSLDPLVSPEAPHVAKKNVTVTVAVIVALTVAVVVAASVIVNASGWHPVVLQGDRQPSRFRLRPELNKDIYRRRADS